MTLLASLHPEHNIQASLNWGREQLLEAAVVGGERDARILLRNALQCDDGMIMGHPEHPVTQPQLTRYYELIERRKAFEPVSKILGEKEFWSLPFYVTSDTLDPRPDSETLIEAVLDVTDNQSASLRVLDLGTGSGCLLLSLLSELKNAQGVGVDCCPKALNVAQKNAQRLELVDRAQFIQGDWSKGITGPFDLIVSNPPYIRDGDFANLSVDVAQYDPKQALLGGEDGLLCYWEIIPELKKLLTEQGVVVMEIGQGQEDKVRQLMVQNGLVVRKSKPDLAGIARCLVAQLDNKRTEV